MNTPNPKYFCPQCRTAYTVDQNYCGRCGTDMKHVSGLTYARMRDAGSEDETGRADTVAGSSRPKPRPTGQTRPMRDSWRPPGELDRRSAGRDRWLGRTIDNRYKVLEVVGRGGMGVVYKVEHQRMGKIAAMKVLHGDLAEDPEVVGRFHREAEAVSRLNHPNTVQVFDFGAEGAALYLIMEYVRGLDLGSLITRDGPLPFDRAAPLFGQICSALTEAHQLGVVHRDLKPENVLVTRTHAGRDFVKVLDFGLAKLSEREEASNVTDRGSIVGTPYYMSPEQIRGEETVDERSDLYSMGALMYKVLTGEPAFSAKSPVGVLTKHLTAELVLPSTRVPELEIHPEVDAIVARAMAKKREARYGSAGELLEALEDAYGQIVGESHSRGMPGLSLSSFGGGSSSARKGPRPDALADDEVDWGMDSSIRLQRSDIDSYEASIKRRRWLRVAVVPLLLAGIAGAVGYWYFVRAEPTRTAEREPNDTIERATLIAPGTDVTGYIGRRQTKSEPDRDVYRVATESAEATAVTISVSGVPNMDLAITLYDPTGTVLHERDELGVGGGESVRAWRAGKVVIVAVEQRKATATAMPVENVSDPYTLRVELASVAAGLEVEPNDGVADARPLAKGTTVTGYLDRRKDVDSYRFTGTAGAYTLRIGGAGSVPLRWRVGNGSWHTDRQKRVTLEPGDLLRFERADADSADGALPGADEPYALELE